MILASNPMFCFQPFQEIIGSLEPLFEGCEFLAEYEHGWHHREYIKDVLSTSDLYVQVHAPFNDINIASMNPDIKKASVHEIEKAMDLAVSIDADMVTVHPGLYSPIGKTWAGAMEAQLSSLKEISALGRERGITVALENMPAPYPTMGIEPGEMKNMLETSGLDFCLDVGHGFTSGKLDDFLRMKPVNVHLHDNQGYKDLHLPLGEGDIDFPTVLNELKGYRSNWVIEGRSLEGLALSKEYLEALLSTL